LSNTVMCLFYKVPWPRFKSRYGTQKKVWDKI
jgi:hypothetical protein